MDRNNLLTTTRTEFLRLFSDAMSDLIPRSMDQLFNRADNFHSSKDQGLFLDARGVLANRSAELQQKMIKGMEQLLNRSFQTAYSSFRPSFSSAYSSNQISLVDSSTLEDGLRIDAMTKRFRNAAEEQLRDLNIRVALLLEQDNIKERENPFRPYLFSRCITSATENLGISTELIGVLSDQLADDLASNVADIYDGINAHLARHGIAAQLQLKIKKSPRSGVFTMKNAPEAAAGDGYQPDAGGEEPQRFSQRATAAPVRRLKTDQLFEMIQGIADNPDDATAENPQWQAATQPRSAGAVRAGWLSGTRFVGETLRTFFSGQSGPIVNAENPGNFSRSYVPSPLTHSVVGLLRENTPSGEQMLGTDGAVRNLIAEQRASLNDKTHDSSEQMTIDIVAMLFEFILRDGQIPAEVRAQLGRLQFLVLKVALQEPELLTRKNHPARMMVNRIGSISIGLKQADPTGARITVEISRIVEELLADVTENPQLFSKMLDELDAFIARELRTSDVQVERAAQAVENAENRTLRFSRTTANIDAALSGLTVAPFLHDFLVTTWAHAIERAGRTDSRREKRFKETVADLLWSIVPKGTVQDRAQLVALLPIMLLELRDGLKLAGLEQEDQQDILNWLVDAHTRAMRSGGGTVASKVPSLSEMHEHFELFIDRTEEDSWPQPDGVQHAGDGNFIKEAVQELEIELQVIDTVVNLDSESGQPGRDDPGSASELSEQASNATAEADSDSDSDSTIIARLRSGVVVELNLDGTWTQGRLTWVSQNTLHLLLSVDKHNTLSVVSLPMFRRLMASGRARFLEAEPLFERAVQSLLQAADQIDGSGN